MFVSTSFEQEIFKEIDAIASLNKLAKFTLGGISGASGGGGSPIGGFIGQLAQKYVAFDTSEASTDSIPSGPSLLNNLNRIRSGTALADNSIQQRHVASGVGTLQLTDGYSTIDDVYRVRFLNSILTGDASDSLVEIIAVTSGYYSLPDMTTHSGDILSNNGSVPMWVDAYASTVTSVFGRTGGVIAANNDYTWDQIDKSVSSLSGITNRDHSLLTSAGTHSHTEIDTHINNNNIHVPSFVSKPNTILYTDGANSDWVSLSLIIPSGLGHAIQLDGGDPFTQRSKLNFTGDVIITDDSVNDATIVNITASGASSGHIIQNNSIDYTQRSHLNFLGDVLLEDDAISDATRVTITVSGTTFGHTIQNEGTPLTYRHNLNFTGTGVNVTDSPGTDQSIVTITAGSGGGGIPDSSIWLPLAKPASINSMDDEFDDSSFDTGKWIELDISNAMTIVEDEVGLKLTSTSYNEISTITQTVPSGDYTVWTRVSVYGGTYDGWGRTGIVFQESDESHKFFTIGPLIVGGNDHGDMTIKSQEWTNYTTTSGNGSAEHYYPMSVYLRVRVSTSGYDMRTDLSLDGISWQGFLYDNITWLPTKVGLFIEQADQTNTCVFPFFRITSSADEMQVMRGNRVGVFNV